MSDLSAELSATGVGTGVGPGPAMPEVLVRLGAVTAEGGAQLPTWVAATAAETARRIEAANLDQRDLPLVEIERVAATMLGQILSALAGGPTDMRLSDDQREIVRDTAARQAPFDRIVAALRLAQSYWTDVVLEEVQALRAWTSVRPVVQAIASHVDATVDASIREYLLEQHRMLTTQEARKRQVAEALVAGQAVSEDECRHQLGLELSQTHVGFIVRHAADGGGQRPPTTLARAAQLVGRALGAAATSTVQHSTDTVWAWASHPSNLHLSGLEGVTDAVSALGARVSVGSPHRGAAGARRSHLDAAAVSRLLLATPGHRAILRYDEADLVALLTSDTDQAARFVRDHLGPLAADTPAVAELRQTLDQYYRANLSLLAAAEPLHVHRNTVVYRLRRISELLGHPVTENILRTRVALLLADQLGAIVLLARPAESR